MATTEERRTASGRVRGAARDTVALLALTGALWLIHVFGRALPTAVLAAAWVALAALIARARFRRARARRAAFLAAYVRRESPLARRLRGGWLMGAREALLGGVLALLLAVAVIRLDDPRAWVVLIAAAPIIVLGRLLAAGTLAPHVSATHLAHLSWRIMGAVVGTAICAVLVTLAFHDAYPDLGSVSLDRAVWHLADQERARSAPAEILLKLAGAKDGLRLWLAQQLMPAPGTSLVQGLGWLIVLAEEAVFVWSYLLLSEGTLIGTSGRSGDDGDSP
ncbi:MAG TPA: hypothetical protein VF329_14345 [Gammaproteobacteria bacterium]